MTRSGTLLAFRPGAWHIARVDADGTRRALVEAPEGRELPAAADVLHALGEMGHRGEGVCVALPAGMQYWARIESGDLPRRDRRRAMLYRLEEQLPVDAEAMTADFLATDGGRSLGVCVPTERAEALIAPLEQAGLEVTVLCPTALLVAWDRAQGRPELDGVLLAPDQGDLEAVRLAGRRPRAWYAADSLDDLLRMLRADALADTRTEPVSLALVGPRAAELADRLAEDETFRTDQGDPTDPLDVAASAAGLAVEGKGAGWINLRRDARAPANPWARAAGPLRVAAVLLLVLLAGLAGALYWRGEQYRRLAQACRDAQAKRFAALYGNRPVPAYVPMYLRSELQRLSGVRGAGFDVPDRPCALTTLARVVENLPPAMRVRILELRATPRQVFVDGQVRSHTDAQTIFQALRQEGFGVDAPRTESLRDRGVGFTIAGRVDGPASIASREGGGS